MIAAAVVQIVVCVIQIVVIVIIAYFARRFTQTVRNWDDYIRSLPTTLEAQVKVWEVITSVCGESSYSTVTPILGYPDDGYDFLIKTQKGPKFYVEVKSRERWKRPTTRVVGNSVGSLRKIITDQDRAYIVVDGDSKHPWGEVDDRIAILDRDSFRRTLRNDLATFA